MRLKLSTINFQQSTGLGDQFRNAVNQLQSHTICSLKVCNSMKNHSSIIRRESYLLLGTLLVSILLGHAQPVITSPPTNQTGLNTSSTNPFMSTNGFQLELDGILTTNPVVIYGSTDLVSWLPLFTNPATTSSIQFFDYTVTNLPARFYKSQE